MEECTRFLIGCLPFLLPVQAGVVQGLVAEGSSGLPMSRAMVRLEPLPGNPVKPMELRSGRSGQFTFPAVAEGLYILSARREGFVQGTYGQRRADGFGTPITVTQTSTLFAEIRMRRVGSITGKVLDENGVGLAHVPVVAYKAQLPLRAAAQATSDDRGIYRIAGIAQGKYWVRSAGVQLEDGTGMLPTFGLITREARNARVHDIRVDAETQFANVQPEPGTLTRVEGRISCDRADNPAVTVTLSSESGSRSTGSDCIIGRFEFDSVAPGGYEILATYNDGSGSAFQEFRVNIPMRAMNLNIRPLRPVDVEVRTTSGQIMRPEDVKLFGRRDDLSGQGKVVPILLPRPMLATGYWEINGYAMTGKYIESITIGSGRSQQRPEWRAERPAEWHDVFIDAQFARLRVTVSDKAAHIGGSVTDKGQPVPGAVIFLWPMADSARRILGGVRQLVADVTGKYDFEGLPAGDYRMLATFDATEATWELLEEARAVTVHMEAGGARSETLPLWVAP